MRSAKFRTGKYEAKLDGDVAKDRVDAYGSQQRALFAGAVQGQVQIERRTKAVLGELGIGPMFNHYYMNYAKKLARTSPIESSIEYTKWFGRGIPHGNLRWIGHVLYGARLDTRGVGHRQDPRLYLSMFEGAGSRVGDVSGYGNHGAITDAVWGAGKIGNGLIFNGTTALVNCGHDASLNITDAITLEAWAKDPPWLGTWGKRIKITVDSGDIDANLTAFPMLVYLSDSSGITNKDVTLVFDEVGANRKKIAITLADGVTECFVEIDRWDEANEKAWLWVPADVVSGADTDLYIYYDNAHADNPKVGDTNSASAEAVWDGGFKMVQHMRDNPDFSHVRDSTTNDNDGTKTAANEPIVGTGKINDGQVFDGNNDFINCGNDATLQPSETGGFTFEAWVKRGDSDRCDLIAKSKVSNDAYIVAIDMFGNDIVACVINNTGSWHISASAIPNDGNWYHVTIVAMGGSYVDFYIDGSLDAHRPTADQFQQNTVDVMIATTPRYSIYGNSVMDEVRISRVARIGPWVKASYESGRDDLLTFGDEEIPLVEAKMIIDKGKDAYSMRMATDGLTLYGYISDNEISVPVTAPTLWHHFVMTYDGTTQRLYIDGVLVNSAAPGGAIGTNATDLKVGELFSGSIDEVRVYPRALSAKEVRRHYLSER